MQVTRAQALRYRVHAQQLERTGVHADAAVLDLGVQDTGPDGAPWALAVRGCEPAPGSTVLVWTLRGAPAVYRRDEIAQVASATAPLSERDAAKRVFDAAKPLKAAHVPVTDALAKVASLMREVVDHPMPKGDVSTAMTARVDEPYLRECGPCATTHLYEQPFRLSALQAGLELRPRTSPPVLERIHGWSGPQPAKPHLDPIRAYLHLVGPATPAEVAGFLDSRIQDVATHWPADAVTVEVDGEPRSVLASDADALREAPRAEAVRLLGPFDLFLQSRDRELLVPDKRHRDALWPRLGRPGAVLAGGELVGTWRPRTSGGTLRLQTELWSRVDPTLLGHQAERLADLRGVRFGGFTDA
ncbi:crosslink repair DNA glycosylase YcaQ family protein [Aeromicrobium sp. IC_218]|uniref:DNA glycosylase AlkZ-like family protein n=1 Tax=Aeromicrobium sp. IC_218 TaxID=2545468 RepID=UPI001040D60E|nr:crosslink repair DNA glycosylase YcaQ family protein [Aeromicrobium sp. IC_218]TCI96024.1 winged helix DNA-binding domain-containing protein [Aeromicrobium sp. IC_218]